MRHCTTHGECDDCGKCRDQREERLKGKMLAATLAIRSEVSSLREAKRGDKEEVRTAFRELLLVADRLQEGAQ